MPSRASNALLMVDSSWVADIGISLGRNGGVGEAFSGFGAAESRQTPPSSRPSEARAGTHTAESIDRARWTTFFAATPTCGYGSRIGARLRLACLGPQGLSLRQLLQKPGQIVRDVIDMCGAAAFQLPVLAHDFL